MNNSGFLIAVLLAAAAFGQQSSGGKAQVTIPGVRGVLHLDVGPTRWEARVRPDGKEAQLRAMDRQDSVLITAFLQKVKFAASAEKCRDEWWPGTEKSAPIKPQYLQQSVRNRIAIVEFMVPEFRGASVHQKNVHAYLGDRDLCAEIHLSKVQFAPEDEMRFEAVLASVQLLPNELINESQGQDEKAKYFAEASRLYLQQNYAEAAEQYQKALDLEKQKRTLSQSMFRVLVDNLGMSYGLTGNLSKAKETFEYGITQDPEYALFHYNMACTYGEMEKMDQALEQLGWAYKYRANMIPGEGPLPDPLKDDSFRKFVSDKKFVDAVHGMQKQ